MPVTLYDKIRRKELQVLFNLDGSPVVVGRNGDVKINLSGSSNYSPVERLCAIETLQQEISNRHFSLELQKGHVYLRDLKSKNGTYVNDEEVKGKLPLMDGDEIFAGSKYSFTFGSYGDPDYVEPKEPKKGRLEELKDLGLSALKSGHKFMKYLGEEFHTMY
ncbi:FHA domain-containing protein [archaeon]|jgi:pSer/pThr/pTyr-binding forkhead associated (FHA) protein|nr:FHA domain-containing protein [archaeon]